MARPREYDRDDLAIKFREYISTHDVPIVAEFAYLNEVPRELLYDWEEFSTLLKWCIDKKEAALEYGLLSGKLVAAGAIFSLKQLGWKDKIEHSGDKSAPLSLKLEGSDING